MKPNRLHIIIAIVCLSFSEFVSAAIAKCPPAGYDIATLTELRERHFDIVNAVERQTFARNLLPCLYSADAKLRDEIGYEAYATWRHNRSLEAATWQFIESSLLVALGTSTPDPDGVIKPFAALVLAEAIKADRAAPFLTDEQRKSLLNAATNYLIALRDYRGFDNDVGWRHGVAHVADLLAQLSLSPGFGKTEMEQILAAIATQVAPAAEHFYVFGESERLAMVAVDVASRGVYTTEDWSAWLTKLVSPAPFANWNDVYQSRLGLAKRHNTMSFLLVLYAQAAVDKRSAVTPLAPITIKAIEQVG
jgi:Protein of unknown function (DUF2785)